jgi:hypothetical protein
MMVMTTMVAAICAVECGSSPEEQQTAQVEKAAAEMQKSAEGMAKGAEGMAQSLENMAKGLGALGTMAGGDPNAKPVDPVSFRDLQTLLPDVSGWEKGKPTGERMTMPVNFSRAEVRYTKGDASIEVSIVDSALNQLLVAPYAMFLTTGYEKETERGYEKSTKIGDYPGWEKWNTEGKDGELNAIVSQRFIVQVEGRNVEDIKALHAVMSAVDFGKLAAMK